MSIQYCENCAMHIDTDYNAEHFTDKECEMEKLEEIKLDRV